MIETILLIVVIVFAFAYNNERGDREHFQRECNALKREIKVLKGEELTDDDYYE